MVDEKLILKSLIFVYGSLKRGYALHHLLETQVSRGDAVTQPLYRIFDLGYYPGLVDWPDGLEIKGELYEIDATCLNRLDDSEGVDDGFYARRAVLLKSPHDDLNVHAWFWLHPVNGCRDCGSEWG